MQHSNRPISDLDVPVQMISFYENQE
uniref:Uncharacterized protein n=1 Tax=Rhizophora mucronata TaxID=61149 RepID=A0A2P2LZK8_RHIMU